MKSSVALLPFLAGCTCLLEATPDGDADSDMDADVDVDADTDTDACPATPCTEGICDEATGDCVPCLRETDEGCAPPTPHCAGEGVDARCVACSDDSDCDHPAAAHCVDDGCAPCDASEQCTHLAMDFCEGGRCIECTVADETACGPNSCDPATGTCTDTPRGSVDTCEACVADSECVADHRCVPMLFMGVDVGAYCLKIFSTGCTRPYTVAVNRTSLSGAPAEDYCGINEAMTTCDAIWDLINDTECGTDEECGIAGLDDGLCETVGGVGGRCTYACGISADCPSGRNCAGAPDYCGG